jgi:hypothetical protein
LRNVFLLLCQMFLLLCQMFFAFCQMFFAKLPNVFCYFAKCFCHIAKCFLLHCHFFAILPNVFADEILVVFAYHCWLSGNVIFESTYSYKFWSRTIGSNLDSWSTF